MTSSFNTRDASVEIRPMNEDGSNSSKTDNWVPSLMERAGSSFKALNMMAKRPPINIHFQDLTYTVRAAKGSQTILSGVSGRFQSGELTAILGPSGAGKSTLMNVLVGYITAGVMGSIQINDHPREMKFFKKLSTYIMQDDLLQPRLTVQESMTIAAKLKLGDELGTHEKLLIVEEILQTLGLWVCRKTRVENLSGGQRKRLSIALELVNNPPVIFLDEPTTGLDVVSVKKCVGLLKLLARQGRTVITTLHQPSASQLDLIDNVYFVADGKCCYQGSPQKLVTFLSRCGLQCPTTHNPADFMMEALQSDAVTLDTLTKSINNGRRKEVEKQIVRKSKPKNHSDVSCKTMYATELIKNTEKGMEFATSFWTQFVILSKRMFLQSRRNSIALWIQLLHHVLSAVLLGGIFFGIGNNGALPIDNFKFCVSILVFFMYTYVMIPILLFPTEVCLLRREYFNRWYSLKSYYAALTIATIPTIVSLGLIFLLISYILTGQLLELDRFILFAVVAILTGLCSEGLGLTVGSTCSVTNGSIIGPASVAPLLALSVYGMGYGPVIEPSMNVLMAMSYLRYGAVGLATALYDNRGLMDCDVDRYIYCHHRDPQTLLKDLGMQKSLYYIQVIALLVFTILYRFSAYLALRYRLTTEFSNKLLNYIAKTTRHR